MMDASCNALAAAFFASYDRMWTSLHVNFYLLNCLLPVLERSRNPGSSFSLKIYSPLSANLTEGSLKIVIMC